MEENSNNLKNRIISEDKESTPKKKLNILFIIIPVISIIVIGVIIFLILFLKKEEKKEEKIIYTCEEGEEDKCLKCENNICISCNPRYNLENGICIANYSLKAIYEPVYDNAKVKLIDISFPSKLVLYFSLNSSNNFFCFSISSFKFLITFCACATGCKKEE